jgi:RNA polymerase sigma-70 factor (ECF subfamily)
MAPVRTNRSMTARSIERRLIAGAKAGDPEAISRLFETLFPKLLNYGAANLPTAWRAEDFAADVMLSVLESIDRYQVTDAPLSAWVFRIARNRLIDASRRSKRRPTCSLSWDLPAETRTHDQVERHLACVAVRNAVGGLPNDQRDVILLRFYAGCSTATTARLMGRTEASIKSLRFRALRSLQRTVAG